MTRKILIFICLAFLTVPPPAATVGARTNDHNIGDCLFCHRETPRFGVDTAGTVAFRDVAPDDPVLCLRCHKPEENLHPLRVKPDNAALGTTVPRDLPLGQSAGVEGLVVCTTCHFVHAADADHALLRGFPGDQKPGLFKAWQDLCRQCHGTGLEKRSPHAGDEKSCAFCHMAKPKEGAPVTVSPRGADLCDFCHGGLRNEHFAKANPFKVEVTCRNCHDPHLGADRPGRLRDSYVNAVRGRADIDPHYRRVFCDACHKDDAARTLVTDDPVALCNRCHGTGEIMGDTHPLKDVPPGIKVPQGWPLLNGALTCLTCHRAGHAEDGKYRRFLRGGPYLEVNDACFQCHNREEFKKKDPHQDINVMKGCEFCHVSRPVPGKDTAATVRMLADINILCFRCHEGKPHPGGVAHWVVPPAEMSANIPGELPRDANGRINCATCHNPHIEGLEEHKIRGEQGALGICGSCHRF